MQFWPRASPDVRAPDDGPAPDPEAARGVRRCLRPATPAGRPGATPVMIAVLGRQARPLARAASRVPRALRRDAANEQRRAVPRRLPHPAHAPPPAAPRERHRGPEWFSYTITRPVRTRRDDRAMSG